MKTTVEKLSSNQVKIDFVVDAQAFEKGMQTAYNKLKGRISIPGFRRGHAPRQVIQMHYGPQVFYDDAFEAIFPDIYREAVEEHKLDPVDRPSVAEVSQIGQGQDLIFSATVYVRPEVTLGQYKGIPVQKQSVDVTEDDVNAELERARERVARFVDVEDRPAKLDDQLDIDYAGFCEGEQFEGGTAQHHKLVLGSGAFIPGFEDQLVGVKAGDQVEVNVTFPTPYHSEKLAGKPAVFKVTVNAIQEKEVPALDDDFAKDVSEFDTLAQYKDSIRERLTRQAEDKADAAFENELIEEAVDNAQVDVPDCMIQQQLDEMMQEMEQRMRYQGLNMQDFLKYTGQSAEQMRKNYKGEAERRVRTRLVMEAIRKAEDIQATGEEIEAEVKDQADKMKKSVEEVKKMLGGMEKAYFGDSISMRKTIQLLKDTAVSQQDVEEQEQREEQPAQAPAGKEDAGQQE